MLNTVSAHNPDSSVSMRRNTLLLMLRPGWKVSLVSTSASRVIRTSSGEGSPSITASPR